ncbi:uncharacterized protein LOC134844411 [Symsagittifera roscoffensis]|uniref:uncharacterized protein LOC134844411 n=1 Tax=Symsagittifera roscoffensis TaxID=84072 RepID=UPI00307B26C1
MNLQRMKGCHSRIARYCKFGLVEMHEFETWIAHLSFEINQVVSASTTNISRAVIDSDPNSVFPIEEEEMADSDWSVLCDEFDARYERFWDMLLVASWVQILICVLGILINCIFLTVVYKRKLTSSTDVYFLNFAIADQCICLSVIIKVLPSFSSHPTVVQVTSSSLWTVSVDCFLQSSLYAAMAVSACFTLERALAVCDPLKSLSLCTRNKSVKICILAWTMSIVYNLCVAGMKMAVYQFFPRRTMIFDESLFVLDITLFYIAPFVLSSVCYWRIIRALRARARMFAIGTVHGYNPNANSNANNLPRTAGGKTNRPGTKMNAGVPRRLAQKQLANEAESRNDNGQSRSSCSMISPASDIIRDAESPSAPRSNPVKEPTHQHMSANRKVTRLMFMIMLSFILLLSPHRLWNLARFFCPELASFTTKHLLNQIASIVYTCNSIVNPLICCLASEIYRQQLKMMYSNVRQEKTSCPTATTAATNKGVSKPVPTAKLTRDLNNYRRGGRGSDTNEFSQL